MDAAPGRDQHRDVPPPTPFDSAGSLPALLAEYGRLAAELPGAGPERAAWLREQLEALDEVIDQRVHALGTDRT